MPSMTMGPPTQALGVALGRRAEHAGVFAAELRRAFIADVERGLFDVETSLRDQQAAGLQAGGFLLVLQRRQRSQRLELAVK